VSVASRPSTRASKLPVTQLVFVARGAFPRSTPSVCALRGFLPGRVFPDRTTRRHGLARPPPNWVGWAERVVTPAASAPLPSPPAAGALLLPSPTCRLCLTVATGHLLPPPTCCTARTARAGEHLAGGLPAAAPPHSVGAEVAPLSACLRHPPAAAGRLPVRLACRRRPSAPAAAHSSPSPASRHYVCCRRALAPVARAPLSCTRPGNLPTLPTCRVRASHSAPWRWCTSPAWRPCWWRQKSLPAACTIGGRGAAETVWSVGEVGGHGGSLVEAVLRHATDMYW